MKLNKRLELNEEELSEEEIIDKLLEMIKKERNISDVLKDLEISEFKI